VPSSAITHARAVGSNTRRTMKTLFILVAMTAFVTAKGQDFVMTPLGQNAADKDEIIKEFKKFIIYKSDTLNRKDASGQKIGQWIEYRKAYLQRTSGGVTVTDSTNASYVLEEKGHYVKGRKNGLWNSYYRDGRIKNSIKYD
jgi:hypothetical protein